MSSFDPSQYFRLFFGKEAGILNIITEYEKYFTPEKYCGHTFYHRFYTMVIAGFFAGHQGPGKQMWQ
jgi:hypothetical protein